MTNYFGETAIDVLETRKGFDGWWDDIPEDIKREIKAEIHKEVRLQVISLLDRQMD